MKRTLKRLFDLGEELGRRWAESEVGGDILDLFCEKIESGDIDWIEARCENAVENVFRDYPEVAGPWKKLFLLGFAAGAYENWVEVGERLDELREELDEFKESMNEAMNHIKEMVKQIKKPLT